MVTVVRFMVRPDMATIIRRNGRMANLSFRLALEQHDERRGRQDATRQQQAAEAWGPSDTAPLSKGRHTARWQSRW